MNAQPMSAQAATRLGKPCGQAGDAPVDPALGVGEMMRRFIASLGQPTRLRDVGVNRSDFPALARDGMADPDRRLQSPART